MDYIIIESYEDRIEVSFCGSKHTLPYSYEDYEVEEDEYRVKIYYFEDEQIIFSSPSEKTIYFDHTIHGELGEDDFDDENGKEDFYNLN